MKKTLLVILNLFFILFIKAQQPYFICGDALYKEYLSKKYPKFKEQYENTLQQIAEQVDKNKTIKTAFSQHTINVVVHVVWKDSVENLDDSIILNQIQVLNEDYNKLNADTVNLRSIFKPILGNAGIYFNLFQVIRKHTDSLFKVSLISGTTPNAMKYDSLGGSSAIDPIHYLNIWVCKIQPITIGNIVVGQIFGYAFPPNNLSNWPPNSGAPDIREDGVVIDYRCFGRNNPNIITSGSQTITIKGRTPTHEIGHYLGLRHIWGDGSVFGNNNCMASDGIQDTPNANNQSNFDCNTSKNTCTDTNLGWTSADMPDLIENYMDYSSEACMNMFSHGQVNWMIATLQGPRSELLNANTVKENHSFVKINIYPNPNKGMLYIQAPINTIHAHVFLQDMMGKTMIEKEIQFYNGKTFLHLADISKGIYILRISGNDINTTEKVIIE